MAKKTLLNYKVVPNEEDPFAAKLIKMTDNPEYDLVVNLKLEKVGIFSFVKCEVDESSRSREISCAKNNLGESRIIYTTAASLWRYLKRIMETDSVECICYSMRKAGEKGDFKPRTFKIKPDRARCRAKGFAFVTNLSKFNKHWKEAFSKKSMFVCRLLDLKFGVSAYGDIPLRHIDGEKRRINRLSEEMKKSFLFKDLKNIYCFRTFVEKTIFNPVHYQRGGGFFNSLMKESWESILKTSKNNSKKRTIGTWPHVITGIEHLPEVQFNRHVKDKLEIRSHLAFTEASGVFFNGVFRRRRDRQSKFHGKLIYLVKKASNKEIRRAFKCFKAHRRLNGRISYSSLISMYQHVLDSIGMYQDDNCSPEMYAQFRDGVLNCRSLKKTVEMSNLMHRDNMAYMSKKKFGNRGDVFFNFPSINPNFKRGGAVVEFLDTPRKVYEEGQAMHHCVGNYIGSAESGDQLIFHITYKDKTATLSMSKHYDTKKYMIGQCLGPHNRPNIASDKGRKVLEKWMSGYNRFVKPPDPEEEVPVGVGEECYVGYDREEDEADIEHVLHPVEVLPIGEGVDGEAVNLDHVLHMFQ